jgi:hypothetical protein
MDTSEDAKLIVNERVAVAREGLECLQVLIERREGLTVEDRRELRGVVRGICEMTAEVDDQLHAKAREIESTLADGEDDGLTSVI